MPGLKISGIAVLEGLAGFTLLWSGLTNQSLATTIKGLLSAKPPAIGSNPETAPTVGISSSSSSSGTTTSSSAAPAPAAPASLSANEATGKLMAAAYGWTGAQWDALYALWEQESGWSNTARNASSGALGIAQALGHGTSASAGTLGNEYPTVAANDGNAVAQIAWGLSYIKSTYGSPEAAWAHEEADGWY